jgi:hypothetical protein
VYEEWGGLGLKRVAVVVDFEVEVEDEVLSVVVVVALGVVVEIEFCVDVVAVALVAVSLRHFGQGMLQVAAVVGFEVGVEAEALVLAAVGWAVNHR